LANAKLCKGNTNPIARAAFTGNLEIIRLLVEKGANMEVPTENGNTALMWASFVGNAVVAEYLISRGAIVNHYNRDGKKSCLNLVRILCYRLGNLTNAILLRALAP